MRNPRPEHHFQPQIHQNLQPRETVPSLPSHLLEHNFDLAGSGFVAGLVRIDGIEEFQVQGVSICSHIESFCLDFDTVILFCGIFEEHSDHDTRGEEGLQNLFQKIYGDSSDEVRKAMNKSFSESGGTVLSTNWAEVGAKKVDVKPPDGTEFKKWDE
uniref:Uncharacterized protein n=1 Tax=Phlebotomus papatasi TaxID=29031 RepID=A0A1B0EXW1_PHLPP